MKRDRVCVCVRMCTFVYAEMGRGLTHVDVEFEVS